MARLEIPKRKHQTDTVIAPVVIDQVAVITVAVPRHQRQPGEFNARLEPKRIIPKRIFVAGGPDDVIGRAKAYEAIVKGENMPKPNIPESFNVLIHELRGLALEITLE